MHRLNQLQPPSDKRIATRVTRDTIRQLRSGHPWVYDGSITKVSHEGAPGDLAVIFGADRSFVAIGLYDPASPIRIKVLHCGKPTQIDDDFWLARVRSAAKARSSLAASAETTGYRCINGENDGLPGLILDRYDRSFVLKLYTSAWFPHLDQVCQAITSVFDPETMVLRMSRSVQAAETFGLSEGDALLGATPVAPVRFREHGLTFEADIVQGQKTGHFLDQRDNRHQVGQMANQARVLDLFSCTGGFSVHAAAGGARSIVSVDQSAQALSAAEANMALNQSLPAVAQVKHRTVRGDVFEVLASMPQTEQFDIVVVDPPSFAQKKASVAAGTRSYRRLTEAALEVVAPGGLLFQASCSSRISDEDFVAAVTEGAERSGRVFTIVDQTGHGIDHPVRFTQGGYLKAVFLRVD